MTKERFQEIRKQLDMTRQQFADAIGFQSVAAISYIESGKRNITPTVQKIVEIILATSKKSS